MTNKTFKRLKRFTLFTLMLSVLITPMAGFAQVNQQTENEIKCLNAVDGEDFSRCGCCFPVEETIRYIYKGEDFLVPGEAMNKYKRVLNGDFENNLNSILKELNFNLVDIEAFKNLKVDSIRLSQDVEFGYEIYVDFREEMIMIDPNWDKWPEVAYGDENYGRNIEDVNEADVIALAEKFMEDYNIDLSGYDKPMIDPIWYEFVKNHKEYGNEIYYMPEINVIFPLLVDGQPVYDMDGTPVGLRVSVDLNHNRVASVWGLFSNNYESTTIDPETDVERILDIAYKGGMMPEFYGGLTIKEVEIDTPQLVLVESWDWNDETRMSELTFVPSLMFNVLDEEGVTYRENIIVPLDQEMLEELENVEYFG